MVLLSLILVLETYVGNEKEGYMSGLVKLNEKAQLRY